MVVNLGGRQGAAQGVDRPITVVEVEGRIMADQIHMCFVVAVDGADIAPVVRAANLARDSVLREVVNRGLPLGDHHRNQVPTDVVTGCLGGFVLMQQVNQGVGAEYIVAHRCQDAVGIIVKSLDVVDFWLFEKLSDGRPLPSLITPNWSDCSRGTRIAATVTPAPDSMW